MNDHNINSQPRNTESPTSNLGQRLATSTCRSKTWASILGRPKEGAWASKGCLWSRSKSQMYPLPFGYCSHL